jgi:DNA-repair protein XRCC2
VDAYCPLRPGNVLEVVGASGCGKTELLVQAAVTCLLPARADGVEYGGNGGTLQLSAQRSRTLAHPLRSPAGVLYLDLDGKLDTGRLPLALSRRVLAARAAAGVPPGETLPSGCGGRLCAPSDGVYAASLAAFRLLRCRSDAALVRAAAALELLVAPPSRAGGWAQDQGPPVRLLLVDNLVRRALLLTRTLLRH